MMLLPKMMMVFSIALVAGCASVPAGDFCDVATVKTFESEATPEYLVRNERALLIDVLVENEYGARNCPDGWAD